MHDLTLGPPLELDEQSDLHEGNCYDGVYGCHLCWNAANGHQGTESTCDWCGKTCFTRVVRSFDEPVLYALCSDCRANRGPHD
jgi:hypothetical protein